ncbi:MAG: hypothetical protein AVDCRST_MAG05-960 [uncultured Rubrobacteraceae bacterium]|uniref:Uncharacterized protein n=1 Tax=uncultured Rubrobacteraceae bacterium TaxID=349277 RepID=A0A6J4RKQ2_9ACTN|nr:MAG: hypothetical protein AVDCRST_MAG05-960 [uncultured Rubrobacteraceae bacterium]
MAFGRVPVVFLEETRTFRRPHPEDLQEVRRLALSEMERILYAAGSPPGKYSLYADRLVAICLAQGAAPHLVELDAAGAYDNEVRVDEAEVRDKGLRVLPDGRVLSGVKDLDVVFFFREDGRLPLPTNRHLRKSVVAELPTLGRRRLDFMKKGVPEGMPAQTGGDRPRDVVRAYLRRSRHGSLYLSRKSVIGLHPPGIFDERIWATRRLAVA